MQELIKINYNTEQPTVSARDLHEALEIKKRFSAWFEANAQGFVCGKDYSNPYSEVRVQKEGNRDVQREVEDYDLSVDMAKHICLMSRTDKGKQCRQYLIDLEDAWNTPEQVMARALKMADATINKLKHENATLIEDNTRMKPKEEFYDIVTSSKHAIDIGKVAKILDFPGIGRNKLFDILRNEKILMRNNVPYQKYIDRGYFRTIETKTTFPNGDVKIYVKTLVYQKGVDYIRKILNKCA